MGAAIGCLTPHEPYELTKLQNVKDSPEEDPPEDLLTPPVRQRASSYSQPVDAKIVKCTGDLTTYCHKGGSDLQGNAMPHNSSFKLQLPYYHGWEMDRVMTAKALDLGDAPVNPTLRNILRILASIINTKAVMICIDAGDTSLFFDHHGIVDAGELVGLCWFSAWTMSGRKSRLLVVGDALKDAR